MANYPPYGYAPQQMGQGQPMMQPQAQPGYLPQQMQHPPQMGQAVQPEPRYLVRPVASETYFMQKRKVPNKPVKLCDLPKNDKHIEIGEIIYRIKMRS